MHRQGHQFLMPNCGFGLLLFPASNYKAGETLTVNLERMRTLSVSMYHFNICMLVAKHCVSVCVLRVFHLEDLDGIGPVGVGVLPRFPFGQALRKHVQIENSVVFWVLDLALKQFHDAEESLQGPADVHNCRENNNKTHLLVFVLSQRLNVRPLFHFHTKKRFL